jgi:hypothetical protein
VRYSSPRSQLRFGQAIRRFRDCRNKTAARALFHFKRLNLFHKNLPSRLILLDELNDGKHTIAATMASQSGHLLFAPLRSINKIKSDRKLPVSTFRAISTLHSENAGGRDEPESF